MPSSTPNDRIRAKAIAESQTNLANNRNAATRSSRQEGQEQEQEQESTPEDRVRAKLQREAAAQSSRRQKQVVSADSTPDERYRAKVQSERKLQNNNTNSSGHLSRKESGRGPRPSSRPAAAAASRSTGISSRKSSRRVPAERRPRQAASARQVSNTNTPHERLRNKVVSTSELGTATSRGRGGPNANTGSGTIIRSGSSGRRRPNGAPALEDRVRQKARIPAAAAEATAPALEDRVRQKARIPAAAEATAANDSSNLGYARTHAENLQDRVRQKASEVEGLDAETIETVGTTTAPTVTRNGPDVVIRNGQYASSNNPRISFLRGSGLRNNSKSGLDPRAAATGAYFVASTRQQNDGGRRGGRGSGRGRGRGERRGQSHSNGSGGRPGLEEGDGNGPSIVTPNQGRSVSFGAESSLATRPEQAHRERRDADPEQGLAPLAVESETDPKKNLWCGVQRTKAMLIAGIGLLVVIGASIGAAAGTGAFTSSASSSSTENIPPPQSPPSSPPPSPPTAAVVKGDECMLTGIMGSKDVGIDTSVAISGDIAAVGSSGDGTTGFVTIHERESNGVWVETATLQPSDGWAGDLFGRSIDLEDDKDVGIILVVGATYNDSGTIRGCVYVFAPSREGVWEQRTKLFAADRSKSDASFGVSVAVGFIFDEFLNRRIQVLIGEPFGDFYPIGGRSGSVHIIIDSAEGDWTTLAIIRPRDREDGDGFGADVDCSSGGRAVVAGSNGLAYTFTQDIDRNNRWSQTSKIELVDDPIVDISGSSVAVYHRTVAVGSGGVVRIFEFGTPTELSRLKPLGVDSLAFGQDVALNEDTIAVSAPLVGGGGGGVGDAFYVFQLNGNRWTQRERYEESSEARIGSSVAVDGQTVMVNRSSQSGKNDVAYVAELC